jgi:hypothetical protein
MVQFVCSGVILPDIHTVSILETHYYTKWTWKGLEDSIKVKIHLIRIELYMCSIYSYTAYGSTFFTKLYKRKYSPSYDSFRVISVCKDKHKGCMH